MTPCFIFIRPADNLWEREGGVLLPRGASDTNSNPSSEHWTCKIRTRCSGGIFSPCGLICSERDGVETLKRNICSVVLILSRSHCPPLPLPHPHPHRRLKQCGQLKQEDITQLLLRISWLKCSRSFYLGGKQPSPLHKGARSLAASQLPSLHLDAALFCAVSTSACNLHFPSGSNRNISIISRSFIARSPHWHPLNTVTSRAQRKTQQPSVSTECSTKPAARKSTHDVN